MKVLKVFRTARRGEEYTVTELSDGELVTTHAPPRRPMYVVHKNLDSVEDGVRCVEMVCATAREVK